MHMKPRSIKDFRQVHCNCSTISNPESMMCVKTDFTLSCWKTAMFLEICKLKHHLKSHKSACLVLDPMPASFNSWAMKQIDKSLFLAEVVKFHSFILYTWRTNKSPALENQRFLESICNCFRMCAHYLLWICAQSWAVQTDDFCIKIHIQITLLWHTGLKTHSSEKCVLCIFNIIYDLYKLKVAFLHFSLFEFLWIRVRRRTPLVLACSGDIGSTGHKLLALVHSNVSTFRWLAPFSSLFSLSDLVSGSKLYGRLDPKSLTIFVAFS